MASLVDLTTSSTSNRSSLSTCLECRFGCLPVCWHTFSWDNHDSIYFRTNQKSWLGIALLVLWETMVEDFEDPTYLSNVIFLKNSKGFKVPENLFLSSYRSHGSKTACEDLFALQTSVSWLVIRGELARIANRFVQVLDDGFICSIRFNGIFNLMGILIFAREPQGMFKRAD